MGEGKIQRGGCFLWNAGLFAGGSLGTSSWAKSIGGPREQGEKHAQGLGRWWPGAGAGGRIPGTGRCYNVCSLQEEMRGGLVQRIASNSRAESIHRSSVRKPLLLMPDGLGHERDRFVRLGLLTDPGL